MCSTNHCNRNGGNGAVFFRFDLEVFSNSVEDNGR